MLYFAGAILHKTSSACEGLNFVIDIFVYLMNPREKFIHTIKGTNTGAPIFCPAIYNYKATFSRVPMHLFGMKEEELIDAMGKEIDSLQTEVVTCGYDIYNVEAEALGSKVNRSQANVFPEITESLITDLEDIDHKLPSLKEPAGRMPVYIHATKKISEQFQHQVYARGGVSGPFSLAGALYDNEKLIMDCMINQQGVYKLLEYCTQTIITYINGFIDEGQDVVVFDSLASPPLVSPELYNDLIFPFHQQIFDHLIKRQVQIRPLIMGGNTLAVLEKLAQTGANQLLLDYNIPLKEARQALEKYDMAFRINIDPSLVAYSNQNQIAAQLEKVFNFLGHSSNLLIGTGILANDTPLENIQYINNCIIDWYKQS